MWKVYSDDYLIYHPDLEDYKIINPVLTLELNKAGSFTFTINSDHPCFNRLDKLKSIIQVYQDDVLYFRGRILNTLSGWHNEKQVTCEGELAFLLDSIQRPFTFPENDTDPASPEDYFTFLINRHNAQVDANHQFTVGNVTVTDPNDYIARSDTEYSSTWQLINEGLIDTLGGYLWVRHENNSNYIDYLSDFDILSNQPIEFGKNLLNLATELKGEDVATVIVPLGAQNEETGERVTIESLEDETTEDICKTDDYVYSIAGQAQYGKIAKTVIWGDVTNALHLLSKAKAQLAKSILQAQTIDITAADLSAAGQDFNSFRLGTYIKAKSEPHGINENYLVKKLSIKLLNPAANVLTLGATVYTFTEENNRQQERNWKSVQTNVQINQSVAIRNLEERTDSQIAQSNREIMSSVTQNYYTKEETAQLVSSASTEFRQTADAFEMRFNEMTQDVNDVLSNADAKFQDMSKYIRFVDGNIIVGIEGNELMLKIQNDKIYFLESGVEIAYFKGRKLYVTDGEFINSLKLGKFAFIPRANGNLSFRKVVE